MKRIIIKGEREVVNFVKELDEDFILISVTSPGEHFIKIPDNRYCKGILQLKFYDIERPVIGYSHFTTDHAKQIKEFVLKNKKVNVIICQCEVGVSRSAGIAAALSKFYHLDEEEIFKNGEYIPNILVYKKLLKAFQVKIGDSELEKLKNLTLSSIESYLLKMRGELLR